MSGTLRRWLPAIALSAFAALWAARWPMFPLVLDPWYHLLIARQMAEAGGVLAIDAWQFAPVGRPHLYPPLLHLGLAGLLDAGVPPLTAIRVASAVLPPALLGSVWLSAKRLAGPEIAGWVLVAALAPFAFHLHSAITLAATLGLIELLWLMVAVERGRVIAAGLLFAALGYTHLGLPWIALAMAVCCALLRPDLRRTLWRSGWGLILVLPWWGYLLAHCRAFHVVPRYENTMVELTPVLLGLAAAGALTAWRRRGPMAWWLACWAAFAGLIPNHLYRWLSGEGMVPVILLAGAGAHALVQRTSPAHRRLAVAAIAAAVLFAPSLARTEQGWRLYWPDSAPWHLLRLPGAAVKQTDSTIYAPQMEHLVREVRAHTTAGEILWSNAAYPLGLIAGLTGRPMASAMFSEVDASGRSNPAAEASLLIWFKLPGQRSPVSIEEWSVIADDAVAVIFRADAKRPAAPAPKAVVPLWAGWLLLGAALTGIMWDLHRGSRPCIISASNDTEFNQKKVTWQA